MIQFSRRGVSQGLMRMPSVIVAEPAAQSSLSKFFQVTLLQVDHLQWDATGAVFCPDRLELWFVTGPLQPPRVWAAHLLTLLTLIHRGL
jgi:hypothetical protein